MFTGRSKFIFGLAFLMLLACSACAGGVDNPPTPDLHTNTPPPTRTPTPQPTATAVPIEQERIGLPIQLLESDPPAYSELNQRQPIVLVFNQPMERASVEAAIQLEPNLSGKLNWLDDNSLQFIPAQNYFLDGKIILRLDASAKSQSGSELGEELELPFITPASLNISAIIPRAGASNVLSNADITVVFSDRVVNLDGAADSFPVAFTIQPELNGFGEWVNASTYTFHPDPFMKAGTKYTITLNPDLISLKGLPLSKDVDLNWSFTTFDLKLESNAPNPKSRISLVPDFWLHFNFPLDLDTIKDFITLTDSGGKVIPVIVKCGYSCKDMRITPSDKLAYDQQYTLTLSGKLFGDNVKDKVWVYTTASRMAYVRVKYPEKNIIEYEMKWIGLEFNNPIDRDQDFSKLVTISPPVENKKFFIDPYEAYYDAERGILWVRGEFEPRKTYTVYIWPGIKDVWGSSTTALKSETFTVSAPSPEFEIIEYSPFGEITFTPDKVSLVAEAMNINRLALQSAPLNLIQFMNMSRTDNRTTKVDGTQWTQSFTAPLDRRWRIEVPLTQGGEEPATGLYFYKITSYSSENPKQKVNTESYLGVVSRTNLAVKVSGSETLIWAVDIDTRRPIVNRPVAVYEGKNQPVATVQTDEQGLARLSFVCKMRCFFVLGDPGDGDFGLVSTRWDAELGSARSWYYSDQNFGYQEKPDPLIYIYTDRPIYQPGQTVYFKVIQREFTDEGLSISKNQSVAFEVGERYSWWDTSRGNFSKSLSLKMNEFGTAEGKIKLPEDINPGDYDICIQDEHSQCVTFKVAEYRKPELELLFQPTRQEIKYGEGVEATIQTRYYFGQPAKNIAFTWQMYFAPAHFFIPDFRTGFERCWYCWDEYYDENIYGIDWGEGVTDEEGTFQLSLSADHMQRLTDGKQPYMLLFEITLNEGSELAMSATFGITQHPADTYVGLRSKQWWGTAGEPMTFELTTVDWQKHPVANQRIMLELQEIRYKQVENSLEYTMEYHTVTTTQVVTNQVGLAEVRLLPPGGGMYQLRARSGNASSEIIFWVAGRSWMPWPLPPDQSLTLTANASQYHPGDIAKIFIPNPYPGSTAALITVERDKVYTVETVIFTGNNYVVEIPIEAAYAPNCYVTVLLVGKTARGTPDYRTGRINLEVSREVFALNVAVTPDRPEAHPGEEITLKLKVTDNEGKPAVGDFSVAVVDKAIFALADRQDARALDYFYQPRPLSVDTFLGLAVYARKVMTRLEDYDFYRNYPPFYGGEGRGGGGGSAPPEIKVRGDFRDTAYWSGQIITDADGLAEITLKLPDNLTTWVVDVRGVTKDTRLGEGRAEVVVNKPLLIRPQAPRFLVEGDHVRLAANVHNHTGQSLEVEVWLQAVGIILDDPSQTTQRIQLADGESRLVTWWGKAGGGSQAQLLFVARAGEWQDAATLENGAIEILRLSEVATPFTVDLAGFVLGAGSRLEVLNIPGRIHATGGMVRLEITHTILDSILARLPLIVPDKKDWYYPIDLDISLLSKIRSYQLFQEADLLTDGRQEELRNQIKLEIGMLQEMQNQDGGWGWRRAGNSDPVITSLSLLALAWGKDAGFDVNLAKFQASQKFLKGKIRQWGADDWENQMQTLIYFVLGESGMDVSSGLSRMVEHQNELETWAKALVAMGIEKASPGDERVKALLQDVEKSVRRSLLGFYWKGNEKYSAKTMSEDVVSTSVATLALARLDPDSPLLPYASRWLVAKAGSYNLKYHSFRISWGFSALMEAVKSSGELFPDFSYSVTLNDENILQGAAADLSGAPRAIEIPLDKLSVGEPNLVRFTHGTGPGRLYYHLHLELLQPVDTLSPLRKGFELQRSYALSEACTKESCPEITSVALGKGERLVRVKLTITTQRMLYNLAIEDYLPAGAEFLNPNLKSSRVVPPSESEKEESAVSNDWQYCWGWWWFDDPIMYRDRIRWVVDQLPPGTYELTYFFVSQFPGEFSVAPAHAYQLGNPAVEATSPGMIFRIEE